MEERSKSLTVLLVDDDPDLVEINRAILEAEGYRVIFSFDIEEAYLLAKSERPELIVLDIMMAHKNDGFTFCYRLKSDSTLSSIPILMLSSVASVTGFRLSLESDREWMKADGFLNKPVSAAVLLEHVERLLQRNRS